MPCEPGRSTATETVQRWDAKHSIRAMWPHYSASFGFDVCTLLHSGSRPIDLDRVVEAVGVQVVDLVGVGPSVFHTRRLYLLGGPQSSTILSNTQNFRISETSEHFPELFLERLILSLSELPPNPLRSAPRILPPAPSFPRPVSLIRINRFVVCYLSSPYPFPSSPFSLPLSRSLNVFFFISFSLSQYFSRSSLSVVLWTVPGMSDVLVGIRWYW